MDAEATARIAKEMHFFEMIIITSGTRTGLRYTICATIHIGGLLARIDEILELSCCTP